MSRSVNLCETMGQAFGKADTPFQKNTEVIPLPGSSQSTETSSTGDLPTDQRWDCGRQVTTLPADTALGKRKRSQPASPDAATEQQPPFGSAHLTKKEIERPSNNRLVLPTVGRRPKFEVSASGTFSLKRIETQPVSASPKPSKQARTVPWTSIEVLHISPDKDEPPPAMRSREGRFEGNLARLSVDSDQVDAAYILACSAEEHEKYKGGYDSTPSQSARPTPRGSSRQGSQEGQSWKNLLAPVKPSLCAVHMEPAQHFVVNKPGLNKGKALYVCSI